MRGFVPDRAVGVCEADGKVRYTSKAAAKRAAKRVPRRGRLHAYECGGYWHLGHVPYVVARGVVARGDLPKDGGR